MEEAADRGEDPEESGIRRRRRGSSVGRKKVAGESDQSVGPCGQRHKGEREGSGRPRRRGSGRLGGARLAGSGALVGCGVAGPVGAFFSFF